MTPTTAATWIPLLPALAAAAIGLVPPLRRSATLAALVSIAAAVASLALALALLLGGHAQPGAGVALTLPWLPVGGEVLAELGVRVDGTSVPMLVVVGLVALLVQVYSVGYLAGEPAAHRGRYFTWQSLFLFAMQGFVLAPNLLQLFAFYELVGLASYLLIGYYHEKPSAGRAAVKAFWITKLGDIGFLIGLLVAWVQFGTFDLVAIEGALGGGAPAGGAWLLPALLFCGVASKSAQFPLHVWLPDAMEGPTPVSALLHAATMVAAGVFLLVRTAFLLDAAPEVAAVVTHVGAFTALFAALVAVAQHDLKRVLAYSTCSQLGLMVAAIGAGDVLAGYFHLITHAAFKALLFLAAGSVIHAVHTNDLRWMGGVGRSMRFTAVVFAIGVLALAGVPPLSGFVSKELILAGLTEHPAALVLALATTLLTPYYMGRAFLLAFAGAPRSGAAEHAHEPGWSMRLPMLVLAVLAVVAGLFLAPFARAQGAQAELHLGWVGALAIVLVLAGLLAARALHGARRVARAGGAGVDALPAGYYAVARSGAVDALYAAGWKRCVWVLALIAAWFDRYVVDGLMNLVGWIALTGGRTLRRTQTGFAPDYVFAIFLALIAIVAWGLLGGS